MLKSELKNGLIELGFTTSEAMVYLALLETGKTTAGPIISKTQLHRNVVYTALDHLLARKLVSEQTSRGVKNFALSVPLQLNIEFTEKAKIAKQLTEAITLKLSGNIQEITVHEGNEEYLALLTGIIKSLPRGSTKYVIGTGGESFMEATMRPIWKKYHEVAKSQGIKIKMLAYAHQRDILRNDVSKEKIYEVRYLPSDMENPAGVHIYPEAQTVLNIIYSDASTSVTAIKIKNLALVNGYLNLFHNLWKGAKK